MRRFRFPLESALVMRRTVMEGTATAYAKVVKKRMEKEADFELCEKGLDRLNRQIADSRACTLRAGMALPYCEAIKEATFRLRELKASLQSAHKQEEESRVNFLKARANARALSRLKEWRLRDFLEREFRKESRQLDDLVASRRKHTLGAGGPC